MSRLGLDALAHADQPRVIAPWRAVHTQTPDKPFRSNVA
jgi:hypothetical protein